MPAVHAVHVTAPPLPAPPRLRGPGIDPLGHDAHAVLPIILVCVAVCCSVLQCVAVCCSVLQCVECVAVCCSVLQCVAVCCSVLQCVAVC